MITLELPIPQEKIAEQVERIRAEIARIQAEMTCAKALLGAVQDQCKHPERGSGNTQGRWEYKYCKICGKEW